MSDTTTKLTYLVGAKRLQEKNRDTEYLLSQAQLEMFEALVRIDECEACAVIGDSMDPLQDGAIGKAIRARGNT